MRKAANAREHKAAKTAHAMGNEGSEEQHMQKKYTELPLDDVSGKELPKQPEIRAQQAEGTAAVRQEAKQ